MISNTNIRPGVYELYANPVARADMTRYGIDCDERKSNTKYKAINSNMSKNVASNENRANPKYHRILINIRVVKNATSIVSFLFLVICNEMLSFFRTFLQMR